MATVRSWAPDGHHLVVDRSDGPHVIDASGSEVLNIDASDTGWLNASTLALLGQSGPGLATGQVRFVDLTGAETGRLGGDFEYIHVSPGNDLLAAVGPPTDTRQGDTYKVWDHGVLSDWRTGEPLAWSADGSLLAVLIPNFNVSAGGGSGTTLGTAVEAGDPGDQGTIAIVDRTGREILHVADWVASTFEDVLAFSPDDRYLAACLQDANDLRSEPTIRVIDVQTGSVSEALPNGCDYRGTGWTDGPSLYISDGIKPPHVWTPGDGIKSLGITDHDLVTPSLDGNLAVWSDGIPKSMLELRIGGSVERYALPGLTEVHWSLDGAAVAAISSPDQLVLIPVAQ